MSAPNQAFGELLDAFNRAILVNERREGLLDTGEYSALLAARAALVSYVERLEAEIRRR